MKTIGMKFHLMAKARHVRPTADVSRVGRDLKVIKGNLPRTIFQGLVTHMNNRLAGTT
jgi:hypothetical protein